MSNSNDVVNDVNKFKESYYDNNSKNTFFKKSQKQELAEQISQNFNVEQLLQASCYMKTKTDVIIDYNVIKLYAAASNYDVLVKHMVTVCQTANPGFKCHLNLNSFTVSAADRHKDLVRSYFKACMDTGENLSEKMGKMNIYYTPSFISQLKTMFSAFITEEVRKKVTYVEKKNSDELWNALVNN